MDDSRPTSPPLRPLSQGARAIRLLPPDSDERRLLTIDARNMRLTFSVSLGPLMVRGSFGEMRGQLVLPGDDIERAELSVDVVAESISTGLPTRDRHLRGRSFLDSGRFPLISYRSERVICEPEALVVQGILSLRGVERRVVSNCPLRGVHDSVRTATLALCGELEISRTDFGVGIPRGLDVVNPIFLVVGRQVHIRVDLGLPASLLLPALLPARGR